MTRESRDPRSAPDPEPDEAERKERVLHTRVPESLDDAIRAAASELGVSVSNLVRNVLANALEVVEAASQEVPKRAAAAAASMRGTGLTIGFATATDGKFRGAPTPRASTASPVAPPTPPPTDPAPVVLGWQEAALNLNAICDRCNAILPRGTRAAIGIADRPTSQRFFRCLACLEELTTEAGTARDAETARDAGPAREPGPRGARSDRSEP